MNPSQYDGPTLKEVEAKLRAHLRDTPDDVAAIHDLGILAFHDGRHAEAVHLLRQASAIAPGPRLLLSLGQVLREIGDAGGAAAAYAEAVEFDPTDALAWNALGVALQESKQPGRALEAYLRSMMLDPERAETANNAGILLFAEKDLDGAQQMFEQALALDSNIASTHSNLGVLWRERLAYRKAAESFRRAWELAPESHEIAGALGEVLSLVYDAEAEGVLRRSMELAPDSAERHFNLSLELLRHGKYGEGFPQYEWRWKRGGGNNTPRVYEQPYWRGESLQGKTLFVYQEQGLGDTLQMLRYIPLLKDRGAKVVLEVQPELKSLVERRFGDAVSVIATGEALPEFEWHVGTMSLPAALGTTMATVPSPIQLRGSRERQRVRRVGLAWAGNVNHVRDRERSLELEWLRPLLEVSGIEWVSLQVGPAARQITTMKMDIDAPLLSNFEMTADVIETLDLVICVDTAVAHLAGSMGVATWLLLPYVADWRWLTPGGLAHGSAVNPWYPAMRVFRQTTFPETNDQQERWKPVVETVARELKRETR